MIYLDNGATTSVKKEVMDVIIDTMRHCWGNPSSVYEFGLESKRIIENARCIIANSINAEPEEIIFTSGASEANALAIDGFLNVNHDTYFITSNVEHSSIPSFKANSLLVVNKYGEVDVTDLNDALNGIENENKLVSVMFANNEIGTINNIKKLAMVSHEYGAVLHTDATAYYPHSKINVKHMGIDMMSVSGHKFGCPKGIGFLYVRKGINLSPIIYGTQQNGLRGGTENVAYIAGLAKAIELLNYPKDAELRQKLNYCYGRLIDTNIINDADLNGSSVYRIPNNINIRIKDVDAQMLIALLDLHGVCVSSGSACHAGDKLPSPTLLAIGLSEKEAKESIRITLSEDTTYEDIDEFVETLAMILTQFID